MGPSRKRNAVQILSGRELGASWMGARSGLEELAEDKACQMQWESQKVELPDSPRSTFLLAFSPDRSLMASTHVNHNIYITEVYTGQCTHSLVGHRRTPWCVTFHPSIKGLLASGCLDGEVRIWDLHGGSESWYTENNMAIASLAFHPTVQLLVVATANEIHFWDWSRPEPFAVVKTANEMERVRLVRFDPLGQNLLTAIVNPSNQQPEEDTEISPDVSIRQRLMLHAQLIRRAPMLHNYLHMPPFRPPGGAGSGVGADGASSHAGAPDRGSSLHGDAGGRTPPYSSSMFAPTGDVGGGGGGSSGSSSSLPFGYNSLSQSASFSPMEGASRTSPYFVGSFQSPRETSRTSVYTVLRDRFGYLTTSSSSTMPTSQGHFTTAPSIPLLRSRSLSASQQRSLPSEFSAQPQSSSQQSGGASGGGSGAPNFAAYPATSAASVGLPYSTVPQPRISMPRASRDSAPATYEADQAIPSTSRSGLDSPPTPPRPHRSEGSGLPRNLAVAGSARQSSASQANRVISSTGWTRTVLGATGSVAAEAEGADDEEAAYGAQSSRPDFTVTAPRLLSALTADPAVTLPPVSETAVQQPGFLLRDAAPDGVGAASGTSWTTGASRDSDRAGVREDHADVQSTIDMYLGTTHLENPAPAYPSLSGDSTVDDNLNNNNGAELDFSGRLQPSQSFLDVPVQSPDFYDLPQQQQQHRDEDESAAMGSSSGSVHFHRCRACHNLLTFNSDARRWERFSHGQQQQPPAPTPPPPPPPPPHLSPFYPGPDNSDEGVGAGVGGMAHVSSSSYDAPGLGGTAPFLPPRGAVGRYATPAGLGSGMEVPSRYGNRLGLLYGSRQFSDRLSGSGGPGAGSGAVTALGAGGGGPVSVRDGRTRERAYTRTMERTQAGGGGGGGRGAREETDDHDAERDDPLHRRLLQATERETVSPSTAALARAITSFDGVGAREHPLYPDPARLSPAAYYAQRLIQHLTRRDSIRQRVLRYQHVRHGEGGAAPPAVSHTGLNDDDEPDDGGNERSRPRVAPRSRLPVPSLGRFTPRRFLLPDYLPYAGIFHERGQPGLATHASVNRVLAGAVVGDGQSAVANNIADITYRLQWWDFASYNLPEISNSKINVLVTKCKIYNDASCDISGDGRHLAAFVPGSHRGFPDEGVLNVYSLAPHNLGEVLYQRRFGPNAISVSLSPMGRYIMVGLASRRVLLQPSTKHMVAQVFRLQQPHAGEVSMRRVFNVVYPMPPDQRRYVSINSARWLPDVGLGLAYGTNRGDLIICRPIGVDPSLTSDVGWDNLYTLSEAVDSLQSRREPVRPGSAPRSDAFRPDRELALMSAIGLQPRGPGSWSVTTQGTQTQRHFLSASTQTDAEHADDGERPGPSGVRATRPSVTPAESAHAEHERRADNAPTDGGPDDVGGALAPSALLPLPRRATSPPRQDEPVQDVIDSYGTLYRQERATGSDSPPPQPPAASDAGSSTEGILRAAGQALVPAGLSDSVSQTDSDHGTIAPPSVAVGSGPPSDAGLGAGREDATAICHRLTVGGMTAVVTRGRVTTMASMGGFGNEIVVSHVINASSQTSTGADGETVGHVAAVPTPHATDLRSALAAVAAAARTDSGSSVAAVFDADPPSSLLAALPASAAGVIETRTDAVREAEAFHSIALPQNDTGLHFPITVTETDNLSLAALAAQSSSQQSDGASVEARLILSLRADEEPSRAESVGSGSLYDALALGMEMGNPPSSPPPYLIASSEDGSPQVIGQSTSDDDDDDDDEEEREEAAASSSVAVGTDSGERSGSLQSNRVLLALTPQPPPAAAATSEAGFRERLPPDLQTNFSLSDEWLGFSDADTAGSEAGGGQASLRESLGFVLSSLEQESPAINVVDAAGTESGDDDNDDDDDDDDGHADDIDGHIEDMYFSQYSEW
ncbi:activating molecule in BECN1-regulated autophagy protein 1A-like isoform X1 [Lethenteron reissneri]|uniref:activating molecule in BECN1-regulated autophagy protein 1A-like isoform X1 n=1 Tax=Lethenteron reissneri TaxID=7753 RepID=UPI002AB6A362|nr:activating molecule in BECN1-regulated autophagy protein 1A-like isoform X1 [Lethenteron reissneri]